MICFFCHTRIANGQDIAHRHEWRRHDDGTVHVYGDDGPAGKLRDAKGSLVKLSHRKCYHADKKQRELADARAADPTAQPQEDNDWWHQDVVEVGELAGEGHRDHRGAGEAG